MNYSTEIELTGLIGSSPIGAMAAFGLLRICTEIEPLAQAKLGWRQSDDWHAVLYLPTEMEKERLVDLLTQYLIKQTSDVFAWSDDVRVLPDTYKEILKNGVDNANLTVRKYCDYLAAFASEMARDNTAKGLAKPTFFYMTSGQQSFLGSAVELVEAYRKERPEKITEALFGPWLYQDKQHALGWDPAAERVYALRHKKPGEEAPTSVSAAIRLALEALPLFPVFPDKTGRLHTSGFIRTKSRENVFEWPLWQAPISLDSLKTLLTSNLDKEHKSELAKRGVNALFRSIRSEFGQGYGIFRPAQLVWQKF